MFEEPWMCLFAAYVVRATEGPPVQLSGVGGVVNGCVYMVNGSIKWVLD